MNQIVRCDWLSERARWSHLARSGLPAVSREKNFPKAKNNSFIDQAFSVKIAGYSSRSLLPVYKHADKEHGQYPAILTSHMVNNPYLIERENQGLKGEKGSTISRRDIKTQESRFIFVLLNLHTIPIQNKRTLIETHLYMGTFQPHYENSYE